MIPGIVANQISVVMGTAWDYLGTSGTHTVTTSWVAPQGFCPAQFEAEDNLPNASDYPVGTVIRQTVYTDTYSLCAYYYYQAI